MWDIGGWLGQKWERYKGVLATKQELLGTIGDVLKEDSGGGSGIRTHGTLTRTPVFKTGALNHSTIPPATHGLYDTPFWMGQGYRTHS